MTEGRCAGPLPFPANGLSMSASVGQIAITISSGLMLGLTHAFDVDHVATVAGIQLEERCRRRAVRLGLAWGIGHATFMVILVFLATRIPAVRGAMQSTAWEIPVGLLLIWMGRNVVLPNRPEQRFGIEGSRLMSRRTQGGALAVGSLHGIAGTGGALLFFAAGQLEPWGAVGMTLVFGFGAAAGMAFVSYVMSSTVRLPWSYAHFLRPVRRLMEVGCSILGTWIVARAILSA